MVTQISTDGLGHVKANPEDDRVLRPRRAFASKAPLSVLLLTEGSYPYHFGGVSTWCHALLESLPEVHFRVMALVADRKLDSLFALPPNVEEFLPVSLWGTYDLLETRHDLPFAALRGRHRATTEAVIQERFVPAFRSFLTYLFSERTAATGLARSIVQMHRFFITHDFDAALRSRAAWNAFGDVVREQAPRFAQRRGLESNYGLMQLTRGMQWIYHWLFPLARPIPRVDVVHAAMAGLCTMVAVTAKLEYGAGYLLTEHGIYLRESYLAAARSREGYLLKLLRTSFARRMAELSYAWADQVGPVCDYNHRWELRMGASPDRLQTMYYGVDGTRFQPVEKVSTEPVVTWVGRIDPLKDIHTLLRAAAIVHRERPDVRFRLYGGSLPGTEDYHRQCLALQQELGLEGTVSFAGYVANPAAAFNEGDVVVLSSISEAMPYSNLEAMLCGKPVIATAVGGVPEQLAGCGFLVEPRNPDQLAGAILELINDPARRAEMGRAARQKVLHMFGMTQFSSEHLVAYRRLSRSPRRRAYPSCLPAKDRQAPRGIDEEGVSEVAAEVGRVASSPPVDALEVAALVESMGITDKIAAARYGACDVFELAEAVLPRVRVERGRLLWDGEADEPPAGMLQPVRELAHGPLALVQFGLMLSILFLYDRFGGWTSDRVFALGAGMSAGVLLASALTQALSRRPSIYLGLGDRASARAALRLATAIAAAAAAQIAFFVVLGSYLLGVATQPDFLTFLAGYAAFSGIWIAATGAIIARNNEWLVLALAVGLGTDVALHQALGSSGSDLAAEAVAGFTAAVAVVLVGGWWSLGGRAVRAADREVLPTHGYLAQEAGPYLAYGLLFMTFFILPHVLGWVGAVPPGVSRSAAIQTAEHGLTLGLAPLLLATGLVEQAAGAFWRRASAAQRAVAGSRPGSFGEIVLRKVYVPHLFLHLLVLGTASIATWLLIESGAVGSLSPWLLPPTGAEAQLVFAGALLAYGLLGWGLFNCTYSLTLARPGLALRDMLPAAGVALALGVPLSFGMGFGYAVIAFAAGTSAFVLTSSRTTWNLLRSADYHYFASV